MPKPGHIMSAVLKAGIKVSPVATGSPGSICKNFRISVTRRNKKGKEIEVKGKNSLKLYPRVGTKEMPSVWKKIQEIQNYYYQKISEK